MIAQAVGCREMFSRLAEELTTASLAFYGERLLSVALFGSVARGTPRPDSDLDVLLVVDPVPDGRIARMTEFQAVEEWLRPLLKEMGSNGYHVELSPVIKTPAEVQQRSPLLLDLTEDARILYDPDGFLRGELDALADRLRELGARRIWSGNAWHWDLKPDYQVGEVFEL